jgi:hypothetical protein
MRIFLISMAIILMLPVPTRAQDRSRVKGHLQALNVTTAGNGAVAGNFDGGERCSSTCKFEVVHNSAIVLTAKPDIGYTFAGWSGDCTGAAECQVQMTGIKNVQASFIKEVKQQSIGDIKLVPNNLTVGGTVDASASANSGLQVAFSSRTPTVCASTGANGSTIRGVSVGTCTIQADQPGNGDFAAALQSTKSFVIEPPRAVESGSANVPAGVRLPIRVGVSVSVSDISKVSDQIGTFEGVIDLQLRWNDPNLAFDARKIGLNRMTFAQEAAVKKLTSIWNPSITLVNAKVNILDQGMFIYPDGTVWYIQRLQGTFEAKYKLAAFPFDNQALPIRVISRKFNANQVILVQEQIDINRSKLNQGIKLSVWNPKHIEFVASSIRGWDGAYYSQIDAKIFISRSFMEYTFAIFVPFLLVIIIPTMLTLHTTADIAPRLGAWAGSILALVALSFTFSTRYSALESDSFVVQLVTMGFAYQLIMILLTVTLLNSQVTDRLANRHLASETIRYIRWALPLFFVVLVATNVLLTAFS